MKLILTVGLQRSGKSIWAIKQELKWMRAVCDAVEKWAEAELDSREEQDARIHVMDTWAQKGEE